MVFSFEEKFAVCMYTVTVTLYYLRVCVRGGGGASLIFLPPQIEYSAFFIHFNKAYLLSLYKINFLTRGSDKNRIASHSP